MLRPVIQCDGALELLSGPFSGHATGETPVLDSACRHHPFFHPKHGKLRPSEMFPLRRLAMTPKFQHGHRMSLSKEVNICFGPNSLLHPVRTVLDFLSSRHFEFTSRFAFHNSSSLSGRNGFREDLQDKDAPCEEDEAEPAVAPVVPHED